LNYKPKIYNFEEAAMTESKANFPSSKSSNKSVHGQERGSSSLARIFWMLIGNVILFFLAMSIYQKHAILSSFDLAYWVIVLLLIVIRYCDIKYLGGLTGKGEPASIAHWRKYVMFLLLIAAGVWLLAHIAIFFHK
jgi:hypothetical protein